MIEQTTLQRYAAQLRRNEPLSVDQQRTLVDAALEPFQATKSVAQREQAVAERESNVKAILTDVNETLVQEKDVWTKVEKAVFIVNQGLKYLRSPKTKDFQSWKDWRVLIDEEFGS